jgi:hypothetical protein
MIEQANHLNNRRIFNDNANNSNNNNNPQHSLTQNNNFATSLTSAITHRASPHNTRFSATQTSPSLSDVSNTISFATLNVRGINSPTKFDSIFDDLFNKSLTVIGLQETKLPEPVATAMFKEHCARISTTYPYKAYWSFDTTDRAGGVGLVITSFISKYVQRIHRYKSRFIAIDLFLPAHKLKIINVYCHQQNDPAGHKVFNKYVINHIKQAHKDKFNVIIMGDFNADPTTYLKFLEQGRTPPSFFSLIEFLSNNNFTDQHPFNGNSLEYATHYINTRPTSRIDLIWFPDEFLTNKFIFDQVWQPPCTQLSSDNSYNLDHRALIVYFSYNLLIGELPVHRRKQKQEWRSFYDVKNTSRENWTQFKDYIQNNLIPNSQPSNIATESTLPFNKLILNARWHDFKHTVLQAAKNHIPIKRVSPHIYQQLCEDETLIILRKHLTKLNQIYAFITTYNFHPENLQSSPHPQHLWFDKTNKNNFYSTLLNINHDHNNLINPTDIPSILPHPNHPSLTSLKIKVASLRNAIKQLRSFKEDTLKQKSIATFEDLRCTNYSENKAAFIASSLNKTKRCIVLDRAMSVNSDGSECLLTEPMQVKTAATSHFQTIAGNAPPTTHTINTLPSRWKQIYQPMESIDSSIYQNLLKPITEDEFNSALASLPNNKAAGLSGIPYEMLKQLPPAALTYLKDLISACFSSSHIPSEWKDATIYPIPKPHDWNCYLKNTRPITLLDTARKLMTRIMYNRLAEILVANKVLQGGNFAGLPGGSCDQPIATLEAIIKDASSNNKPLFILQQDISKAFDSIDTNMLRLAMDRLKIPKEFTDLTLELFTNRYNTVITAFGPSLPYKVQIGIDQGEVISPLLWVIYIDPLLTALNIYNTSPYVINSNPNIPPSSYSTLGYMDDTNLIAASIHGIENMLNIAQEFYNFNNTKANPDKAILICNRDPSNMELPLPPTPIPHEFNIHNSQLSLTPLPFNESFRFLGVWFTLSLSSKFVKNQCKTEFNLFSNKLRNKRLTFDQLLYLHNSVLIPKIDFRLKATILSERDCIQVSSPFKKLFKNSLKLSLTTPNAFLHFSQAIGLTNLYQRQLTNHVSSFSKTLSLDDNLPLKNTIHHRLHSIQQDLYLPHSPLMLEQYQAFTTTQTFKLDYIFRLLCFSRDLGIQFSQSLPFNNLEHHTPIYLLFHNQPALYNSSLRLFKRHNIQYLSDCISDNCLTILPFKEIIRRNSQYVPSKKIPKWYHHIVEFSASAPKSIRIKHDYTTAHQQLQRIRTLDRPPITLESIMIPKRTTKSNFWCANWNHTTNQPNFGQLIKNSPYKVYVVHWTRVIDSTSNATHTPSSQPLKLIECQGCELHEPNAHKDNKKGTIDNRLTDRQCLFTGEHEEFVDLKHLQQGYLKNSEIHTLRSTYLQLSHMISTNLNPPIPNIRPVNISTNDLITPTPLIQTSFIFKDKHFKTPPNMRGFVKEIFNALNFSHLLSLEKFNRISFFHHQQVIDWDNTWSLLKYHPSQSKTTTSFPKSSNIVFSIKLMLDELPWLTLLQTYRRPDLYKPEWNCILCHEDKENWFHIWKCPHHESTLRFLCNNTKETFESAVRDEIGHLPHTFINTWSNLPCFSYPTNDLSIFSFESLIRGFVPTCLTNCLNTVLPKKKVLAITNKTLFNARSYFREHIWQYRCEVMSNFEKHMGITSQMKTSPYQGSRNLPNQPCRTTSITPATPTSDDEVWKSWIAQAIDTGHPWRRFSHTR